MFTCTSVIVYWPGWVSLPDHAALALGRPSGAQAGDSQPAPFINTYTAVRAGPSDTHPAGTPVPSPLRGSPRLGRDRASQELLRWAQAKGLDVPAPSDTPPAEG
jgi:hypothetical protein